MRIREPDPAGRRLTDEQRTALRRHIAAVPPDATPEHPAIRALIGYVDSLGVPWWVPAMAGAIYLRLGCPTERREWNAAEGFDQLRGLCDIEDWGRDPSEWALVATEPQSGNGHVRFES